MQDLSDVLARYLDEIDETDCTVDDIVKANPTVNEEVKSLLYVADKIKGSRKDDEPPTKVRERSRRSFFRRFR